MSGLASLSRPNNAYAFSVRSSYAREVEAIVNQMVQLGQSKVALLSDGTNSAEVDALLQAEAKRRAIRLDVIRFDAAAPATLAGAVDALGGYHAVVMNVSSRTVDALVESGLADRPQWPRTLLATSTLNLSPLLGQFQGRVIGFTMVVPNPDVASRPLSRELAHDADQYSNGRAMTFVGMEAYISARLLVAAMRAAGKVTPERLRQVLATTGVWDVNGFRLSFAPGRATGSDWVDVGLRAQRGAGELSGSMPECGVPGPPRPGMPEF
jgi:ABC-type branched-subunit amino acid transport system substrate-binding protein